MFENQTAPYDDVVAAILRLWIVDQVSLACRGYGIVWARSANSKKKNASAGVPSQTKSNIQINTIHPSTATTTMTPGRSLQK